MKINNISITNFRNHRKFELELPDFLYIEGDNGKGKTSIIEALYIILTLKSFKSNFKDIKTLGEEYFRISACFAKNYLVDNSVFFYNSKRQVIINGYKNFNTTDYTYFFPVICYSPNYETILSYDQSYRRNFIDRIIFYTDIKHMKNIKDYNLLLKRKRSELYSISPDYEILKIMSEKMLILSSEISKKRSLVIEKINNLINSNNDVILKGIELNHYINTLNLDILPLEIKNKRPLSGCHKDLFNIKKDGQIIEKFQSFGQRKSCLLLLLYYFTSYLREQRDSNVILLMDDFEAGIDKNRINILADYFINSSNNQIIFTGLNNNFISNVKTISL